MLVNFRFIITVG